MQSKYTIKRLSEENIHALIKLYREVFCRTIDYSFIAQKYNTKYLEVEYIGHLAYDECGAPVAYYGIIPCRVTVNGKILLAAQSADTMTHPRAQKRGLFVLLAKATFALAKEKGIQFVFGFPNQNSFGGLVKLGWKFTSKKLKSFRIGVPTIPFAKIAAQANFLTSLYEIFIRILFSKNNTDPASVFASRTNEVTHDASFFRYKSYHPTYYAKIKGTSFAFRIDRFLRIGYVQFPSDDGASRFIRRIKRIAIVTGCREILFITHENSQAYQILSRHLPSIDSFPIGFLALTDDNINFEEIVFDYYDIDIF